MPICAKFVPKVHACIRTVICCMYLGTYMQPYYVYYTHCPYFSYCTHTYIYSHSTYTSSPPTYISWCWMLPFAVLFHVKTPSERISEFIKGPASMDDKGPFHQELTSFRNRAKGERANYQKLLQETRQCMDQLRRILLKEYAADIDKRGRKVCSCVCVCACGLYNGIM